MDLRQMLLRDFKKKLPISGGFGQSVDEPIVITTPDPEDAALTQLEVARCIYGFNGRYWRLIERTAVPTDLRRIEKMSCEIKFIEDDQVITETRNFYFDLSAVELRSDKTLPNTTIPLGDRFGVRLPWQLGWFHFDRLIDNETDNPGLGMSVSYSAPEAKLMVFAYDKGQSQAIIAQPDESAAEEFNQSTRDFEVMHPNAEILREYDHRGVRFKTYDENNVFSVVLLAPFRDFFFKLRLTLDSANEAYMFECAWSSVMAFASMLGNHDEKK
jgi:hypothetical protein